MFFGFVTNAQTTVSIPDTNAAPGEIVLPVNAPGLGEIGSMTLNITFDGDVLEFVELLNNPFEGEANFILNSQENKLTIVWYSLSSINIEEKVFDIKFNYLGGSSAIAFEGANEFTDESAQTLNVTFVDGSIAPFEPSLTLSNEVALPGEFVSVKLRGRNLVDVGSLTLYIEFDPDVLEFVDLESDMIGFLYPGTGEDGKLTLAWFHEQLPVTVTDNVIVELLFYYVDGNSDVSFGVNSEVTDSEADPIVVSFVNGSVRAPSSTFLLPDVEGYQESEVIVPLIGQLLENIGSFTISISYDASVASFNRFENLVGGDLVVNETVSGGVATLSMAYAYTTGFSMIEGSIVDLVFDISDAAVGSSTSLSFGTGEVTDVDGNELSVSFVNGSISVVEVPNAPPYFTATVDGKVYVPEYFEATGNWKKYIFTYKATDPEGDALSFALVSAPSGVTVNPIGLFSWSPDDSHADQVFDIIVSVTDGEFIVYDTSSVTVSTVVGVLPGESIPTDYSISQNYPNPFNPSTSIKFGIPQSADVTVKVFNILGQEIATLINNNLEAGYHIINFNASNLISGMYFYRIQANGVDGSNFTDVKKMLLVK